jgi:transposase
MEFHLSPCHLGPRLAISAMLSKDGIHERTVDVWETSKEHNMTSARFVNWIAEAAGTLRAENGSSKICIIIDNAPWHNELTEETKMPKRAWVRARVIQWLEDHQVPYLDVYTKAELLELANAYSPRKIFKTDEAAAKFDVDILRLPIRHCVLNPIELAWAEMKNFIRNNNVTYTLRDVSVWAKAWMASCDMQMATSFIEHTVKYEQTFKKADAISDERDKAIIEDDVQSESESEDAD